MWEKFGRRIARPGSGRVRRGVKTTTAPKSVCAPLLVSVGLALILMGLPAFASERWATLEAIHCVENPRDLTRPGRYGELGAYQFRERTWRMHTGAAFALALDRRVSDAVAVKHYEFLKRELGRAGIAATPYSIALAWNGGLSAAVRGRTPAAARDYAERVANLAGSFDHGSEAGER